jgi:hypothetical protein
MEGQEEKEKVKGRDASEIMSESIPEPEKDQKEEKLVKSFPKKDMKNNVILAAAAFIIVFAGIGTGWFLSDKPSSQVSTDPSSVAEGVEESKTEAGITDEEAFPDSAEGILVEGGINGEGTHHLDRGLGPEKDVYLTSTVINLDDFKDKKVKVWGETISAQKAGWLMDVGRIKVVE